MNPTELLDKVSRTQSYRNWKAQHPHSFLSHFFCQVDAHCVSLSEWEVGFYNTQNDKIIVFIPSIANFRVEDEVFKRDTEKVEELQVDKVKITLEQAQKIFHENLPLYFPKELLGNGFITLQTMKNQTFWNFTFLTKTIKFVNLKIDGNDGKILEHNVVEVIDKGK